MTTDPPVVDNRAKSRFELERDGQVAILVYERHQDSLVLVHTEVPPELRGQHLGDVLARAGLKAAHDEGLRVVVVCPFVRAYLQRHPQS